MEKKLLSRKEQAQITKQNLFETAIQLINENGYDNTTVSQICKKSGVSKGTFYVHYESKEDIVRESYYSGMGNYVKRSFEKYLTNNPSASLKERITRFLTLEFEFTNYIGYELTCLSYITNLSSCIPGPCKHLERRVFSTQLKELLEEVVKKKLLVDYLSVEEAFLYLETSVRGVMASWCFANAKFNIEEVGKKYVMQLVNSIIQ
jgi:AcrR family transcriptional regulator